MKRNVIMPYPLLGWISQQKHIEIALYRSYEEEYWVVIPPYPAYQHNDFARELYQNLQQYCEMVRFEIVERHSVIVKVRFPNNAESTDYEPNDFCEPEAF